MPASDCQEQKRLHVKLVQSQAAVTGTGQLLTLIDVGEDPSSRCVAAVILLPSQSGAAEIEAIGVGDLANGSDQVAVDPTTWSGGPTDNDILVVRFQQIYGRYIGITINGDSATNVTLLAIKTGFRDHDAVGVTGATSADAFFTDVICTQGG